MIISSASSRISGSLLIGVAHHALRSAIDFGRVYGVYVYDARGKLVKWVLAHADNNKRRTAEILGVGRRTIYRKLGEST